jgi:hypothetical protein
MPFAYYKRLTPTQKKIYDKSDSVSFVNLPQPERFQPYLEAISKTLATGNRSGTEFATQEFVSILTRIFGVPPVKVRVLERRPSQRWGELHGLYERGNRLQSSRITVWMRTAKREQVVVFKTFLRTLLHEVMHHLDYTYLRLGNSFHTEGFYKRESSLLKQLFKTPSPYKGEGWGEVSPTLTPSPESR